MELKVKSIAGTLESSDIQIIVEPSSTNGIEIELESPLFRQYGEEIKSVIIETVKEFGVSSAKIYANDKGAISPVIKSRVQTAISRSLQLKNHIWK